MKKDFIKVREALRSLLYEPYDKTIRNVILVCRDHASTLSDDQISLIVMEVNHEYELEHM